MTETPILDERAVSEIEARFEIAARVFQPYKEVSDSLCDIPALCATVKHLRERLKDLESRWDANVAATKGYMEQRNAAQSQLEQLRAENARLSETIIKQADYRQEILRQSDFRTRAIQLCKDKAAEWAKQSEEAQGRGIQVVADGKASRALAAKELAAELEKL